MKARTHIAISAIGACVFFLGCVIALQINPAIPRWYHAGMFLPVQMGLFFGKGGEDVSAIALYITWGIECVVFGTLASSAIGLVHRRLARKS